MKAYRTRTMMRFKEVTGEADRQPGRLQVSAELRMLLTVRRSIASATFAYILESSTTPAVFNTFLTGSFVL